MLRGAERQDLWCRPNFFVFGRSFAGKGLWQGSDLVPRAVISCKP